MAYQGMTYANLTYLAIRFVLWLLLGLLCFVDFCLHRHSKARGYKLHRAISATLAAFVFQEMFTVAWIGDSAPDPTQKIESGEDNLTLYGIMVFFHNLAESMFLGLLLLMSTGWQITQRKVQHRAGVMVLPALHFVTSLVQDYIVEAHAGHSSASVQAAGLVSGMERTVLFVSSFIALLTLFYSWYFVFVCVGEERKLLSQKINAKESPAVASSGSSAQTTNGTTDGDGDGDGDGDDGQDNGATGSTMDTSLEMDEDMDEDSTVPMKAKRRMLVKFHWLVQLYFCAVLATLFLDIFGAVLYDSSGQAPWARIVLDLLVYCFMASLTFVFRLRSHNPYFMLEDYTAYEAGADDSVDVIPMSRVVTSDFSPVPVMDEQPLPAGTFVIDDSDEEEIWATDRTSFDTQSSV